MIEKYQYDLKSYKIRVTNLELVAKEEISTLEEKLNSMALKVDNLYGLKTDQK